MSSASAFHVGASLPPESHPRARVGVEASRLQVSIDAVTEGVVSHLLSPGGERASTATRALLGVGAAVGATATVLTGGAAALLFAAGTASALALRGVVARREGPHAHHFTIEVVSVADCVLHPPGARVVLVFCAGFGTEKGHKSDTQHILRGVLHAGSRVDLTRCTVLRVHWEAGAHGGGGVAGLAKTVLSLGIANPFSSAWNLAKKSAPLLAAVLQALLAPTSSADPVLHAHLVGTRCVLMGHSLGARLVLHTLRCLAAAGFCGGSSGGGIGAGGSSGSSGGGFSGEGIGAGDTSGSSGGGVASSSSATLDGASPHAGGGKGPLVHAAVLLAAATGGPEDKPADWAAADAATHKLINVFNAEDVLLVRGLLGAKLAATSIAHRLPPAGARAIDVSRLPHSSNVDASGVVHTGHSFSKHLEDICAADGLLHGLLPLTAAASCST